MDEEKVKKFKGDFGVVAEYFLQKRKNHSYKPSSNVLKHVKEITEMLAALTGDARYVELYEPEMEEREVSMCEILDAAINKGIEQGMERGMALGRSEGMALGRSEGMELGRSEGMELGRSEGMALGRSEGMALGRSEGMALGRSEGMALGEVNIMNLIRYLVASNREEEIKRLAEDEEYLEQLRKEMEAN